jgi:hypothetical protein
MKYGELPTSPVVFAAADSKYFLEHAGPFAYSAAEHGFDIHIHVVNPTDEVLSYAAILASTVETRLTYTFNDEDLSSLSGDPLRAYYACLRFGVAPMILQQAGKIIILDIDCLVMNKFEFPDKPIGYFPRTDKTGAANEWEKQGMKIAAGAVYFDREALNVCEGVAQTIAGLPMRWFNDQIALSHIMDQVPEQFVHKFDSSFMDWEFKEGTTIWTGKGPRKYDNPTYVAEKHKYDRASDFIDYAEVVILTPRLDLMFKRNGLDVAKKDIDPIRKHWKNFVFKLSEEVSETLIITAPRWFFNKTIADEYFPKATVYVPHVEKSYWGGGDNCKYYMQTVFPWLFTIDEQGWAGGSKYKESFKNYIGDDDTAFNELQQYIKEGGTKFKHLQGNRDISSLVDNGFVLVPLQLPHDETIKYHSDVTVPELVEAMCKWADESGVPVVFKGHPVNLGAMAALMEIIQKYKNVAYVTDYNINDLIHAACATYVVNSGTGQEAMLHDRPVVVFGRCDYEGAVIRGDLNDLAGTWERVKTDDFEARKATYRRWFDWFVESVTYDTRI